MMKRPRLLALFIGLLFAGVLLTLTTCNDNGEPPPKVPLDPVVVVDTPPPEEPSEEPVPPEAPECPVAEPCPECAECDEVPEVQAIDPDFCKSFPTLGVMCLQEAGAPYDS